MFIAYYPSHFSPQTTIITFHLVTVVHAMKLVCTENVNFKQVISCASNDLYMSLAVAKVHVNCDICRQY